MTSVSAGALLATQSPGKYLSLGTFHSSTNSSLKWNTVPLRQETFPWIHLIVQGPCESGTGSFYAIIAKYTGPGCSKKKN